MIGKRFVLAGLAMALGVLLLLPETGMGRDRGNGGRGTDRGDTSRPGGSNPRELTPPPPTEAPRPPMDSAQPVTKPKSSPPDTSR